MEAVEQKHLRCQFIAAVMTALGNESQLYFPFPETLNNVRLSHEKWLFLSKIDSIKKPTIILMVTTEGDPVALYGALCE